MRRRLILLFAFAAAMLGSTALAPAHAAAGLGKTGLYKDACGNTHVWVNGQDLGPQYLVCVPVE